MTSETDRAYMAGIIDGEGSIMVSPYKNMWQPSVSVATVDRELLEWIRERWGGSISSKKVYAEHHKQSYQWRLTSRAARALLREVSPYLRIQRKILRAKMLLEEYDAITPRNGYYTPEMRQAKEDFVKRFHEV